MFIQKVTSGAVDNINTRSTAEPRHGHSSRLLRLLNQSANGRVSYHRVVDVEALRQHKWICIIHMETIVQSTGNVATDKWISCIITNQYVL